MDSLDFKKKKAHVQWNRDNQTFLCCLFHYFNRDNDAFRKVFISTYGESLKNFDHELPFTTLSTQWHDLRRHGDPVWSEVHIESPFPAQGPLLEVVCQIKETANAIGVSLVEKEVDDIDTSKFCLNPLRRQHRDKPTPLQTPIVTPSSVRTFDSTLLESSRTMEAVKTLFTPSQPVVIRPSAPEPLCTAEGKICFWCFQEATASGADPRPGIEPKGDIPPLLYRWANVDSQGVNTRTLIISGLFSNTEEGFFYPQDISQHAFDQYVRSHVSITRSLSPFVSTFQSLLAPVHRAIRAREGAIISVIDPSRLERVYSAKDLIRDLKINIRGYRGIGEYLVWGKILTPAIICSFTASNLMKIAEEDEEIDQILQLCQIESSQKNRAGLHATLSQGPGKLDHRCGLVIGRLLRKLGVPSPYVENVAVGLSHSWRFSRGNHEDFLKGAREGYALPMPASTGIAPTTMTPLPILSHPFSGVANMMIVDEPEEPSGYLKEESDGTMSTGENEEYDDPHSTIESPCPAPKDWPIQSIETAAPTVEFFNPMLQTWTANETGGLAVEDPERSSTLGESPVKPIQLDDEEAGDSMVMEENDLDILVGDLLS